MKTFLSRHKRPLRLCLSLCIMAVLAVTPCIPSKAVELETSEYIITNPTDFPVVRPTTYLTDVQSVGTNYSYWYEMPDTKFTTVGGLDLKNVGHKYFVQLTFQMKLKSSDGLDAHYFRMNLADAYVYYADQKLPLYNFTYADRNTIILQFYGHFTAMPGGSMTYQMHTIFNTPRFTSGDRNLVNPIIMETTLTDVFIRDRGISTSTIDSVNDNIDELQNGITQDIGNLGNNLTNGYDSTQGNSSLGSFNEGMGKLEDAQSSVTDSVYDKLDDLSIPTGGIGDMVAGLTATAPIVSSMLQAMFQASGDFTIIMTVTLILTIVCMLLGIAKYFVR